MNDLKHFRYWCYKVLPLVYDDSLSYYEVLCKVVDYINKIIDDNKAQGDDIKELQEEIKKLQDWMNQFDDYSFIEELLRHYIAQMIFVDISDAGYIIYHIPSSWNDVQFNTTGLDITDAQLAGSGHLTGYDYGQLVLSMFAE